MSGPGNEGVRGGGRGIRARIAAALVVLQAAGTMAAAGQGVEVGGDGGATGRLVIVGGGLDRDNAAVYGAVMEGRDGGGSLCVIPTASGVPERSMVSAVERFRELAGEDGAVGVFIPEDSAHLAGDAEVVERLEACSGFWFTGGVQSRIVEVFRPGGTPAPAYEAIRRRHQEGAVVAGSSAGAAMMSDPMIAGGSSAEALRSGIRRSEGGDGVLIEGGMGFFPGGFLDQHFLARGRWGRLVASVLLHPEVSVGFGIDENTALVVDGDEARVVGESGVVVVDGRAARGGPEDGPVEGLHLLLAGAGDRIDLGSLTVVPGAGKRALVDPGGASSGTAAEGASSAEEDVAGIAAVEDPFERWALLRLLVDFAAAPDMRLDLAGEGYALALTKVEGFRALRSDGEGVQGAPAGFHAGPFRLDVRLVR